MSQGALRGNVLAQVERAGGGIVDLRRDAWGHGLSIVAPTLREIGVKSVLVDADACDHPELFGLTPVAHVPDDELLDADNIYGFPGSFGEPVFQLLGRVLSTKVLRAGEGVSYNHTHVAQRDTVIALITGGFGQGIPRAVGNNVYVEIDGVVAPIIGRVAMDVSVVDVGCLGEVERGADVVYFGSGSVRYTLADWQKASGLLSAEIVCAVGLHSWREATQ